MPVSNIKVQNSDEVLEYMGGRIGRISVLPALFDSVSITGTMLLQGDFPLITSSATALASRIIKVDQEHVVFEPQMDSLAAMILSVIRHRGFVKC